MKPGRDWSKGRPEPIRLLNHIVELETGEPMVDLREYAPRVKMARQQVIPFVRETVAKMVHQASLALPEGVHLGLVEGWRPLARQQRIYDFMWRSALEAFPNRNHASLRRTVCRWVAPTDQKAPPGHCTGAAVDVWLLNDAGREIDVWSPHERFAASPTFTLGLDEEPQRHRTMLYEAMMSAGFSNCRDEWWHYSFGDAGWAVRTGEPTCSYGLTQLDPSVYDYRELERLSEEALRERPNPFLAA